MGAPRWARSGIQQMREGIIAPTTPMHLVQIKSRLPSRKLQVQYLSQPATRVKPAPHPSGQKIPSAAFASSDIISGLQGGRSTNSGLTSSTLGTPLRNPRI